MFDSARECNQCFKCIGLINQKKPEELQIYETAKLLEYKMYQLNLNNFAERVNENYRKNGGYEEIRFSLNCNPCELFKVTAETYHVERGKLNPINNLSNGMKSLYMLSLLETYTEDEKRIPSIVIVEDPEIFLHPQLQKISSEILYRLSKKNQVIFTTHSPSMLFNFTRRQIRQVVLERDGYSVVRDRTDIDAILDDLGYGANDLLGVSFVFIVEGKQDKSRLPLLLEKYYSEIYDEEGNLSRISIITTNSCTNIKTYANLKYMNQVYLRDQFLMIRDGDGKNPEELAGQLCRYYDDRSLEDVDKLPKVTRKNVLILKYYSFENYFLNPKVMTKLGVVEDEDAFYRTLFDKWKEYLYRLKSGKQFAEAVGKDMESPEDLKVHMEEFKIYMRGHNLYDIFYGPYKKQEGELLKQYIDLAPREDFSDILDAIDKFVYFESRKA
jgi:putative ATP-dependent endonuclease of OLD family